MSGELTQLNNATRHEEILKLNYCSQNKVHTDKKIQVCRSTVPSESIHTA